MRNEESLKSMSRGKRHGRKQMHSRPTRFLRSRSLDCCGESQALRRGTADFEAPASVRIARVRYSPIKPKKLRPSIQKITAAHTLFTPFRRWRSAPLDVSYARLMHRSLRSRQHHVVRIADGLEDVDAADTGLARNVHGPIWQLGTEDDHLCKTRLRRRLVPLEDAQWPRTSSGFREDDLVDLARKVESQLPLRASRIEGQKFPVQGCWWSTGV